MGVFLRPSKDVVGVGCNCKFAVKGVTFGMISNHLLAIEGDYSSTPYLSNLWLLIVASDCN